jgi:hypothetical protein
VVRARSPRRRNRRSPRGFRDPAQRRAVPRDGRLTPEQETRLRREAAARLGDTEIAIVTEARLPRSDRGKLRLVVRTDPATAAPVPLDDAPQRRAS